MVDTLVKDAQYFIDHPADNPSIDELINTGVLNEDGSISEPVAADADKADADKADADKADEKKEEDNSSEDNAEPGDKGEAEDDESTSPDRDEKGRFISTKDGKGNIPYDVLAGSRREAAETKEQFAKLADDYDGMKQANLILAQRVNDLIAGNPVDGDLTGSPEVLDFDPATYEEEFGKEIGGLAKALKSSMDTNNTLLARIDSLEESQETIIAGRSDEVESYLQDVIDSIPELADWQVNDPDKFDAAVNMDNVLKENPKFKDVSFEDRFKKAVGMVSTMYGSVGKSSKGPTEDEIVDAAVNSADPAKITSLSHVDATVQDLEGIEKIEGMSSSELNVTFSKLTSTQQNNWLRNNLGGG